MNKIVVLLTVAALFSFNTAFAGMTGDAGDDLRDQAAKEALNYSSISQNQNGIFWF